MARPKKAAHEKLSEVLYIRLTPEQFQYVQDQASLAGLDHVEYARAILTREKVIPLPASDRRANVIDAKLLSGINRIGNNVNQLARAAHRGSDFTQYWGVIGQKIEQLLNKIDQVYDYADTQEKR